MDSNQDRKLTIYQKMLSVEDSLHELEIYSSLQDRAVHSTIAIFTKRWSDVVNRYEMINKRSFTQNVA
jgi:hypothetical protein